MEIVVVTLMYLLSDFAISARSIAKALSRMPQMIVRVVGYLSAAFGRQFLLLNIAVALELNTQETLYVLSNR